MTHSTGFALAREWIIGILLAFIIPMATYYGVEVFFTYVKKMPQVEYPRGRTVTEQERDDYREKQNRETMHSKKHYSILPL